MITYVIVIEEGKYDSYRMYLHKGFKDKQRAQTYLDATLDEFQKAELLHNKIITKKTVPHAFAVYTTLKHWVYMHTKDKPEFYIYELYDEVRLHIAEVTVL